MNYLSLYKKLTRKAKKEHNIRKLAKKNGDYYEEHHIIPKSKLERQRKPKKIINGSWNLVLFTGKEHHMAHWFIYKACLQIYGEHHRLTIDMLYTINMMSNFADIPNSKLYENMRKEHAKMMSERIITEEFRENSRNRMIGEKNPNYKKSPSEETIAKSIATRLKNKIPAWNKGLKCPQLASGKDKFGSDNPSSKKYRLYFDDGRIIEIICLAEWCRKNGYRDSNIHAVLNGKAKYHKDIIKVEKLY